MFEAQKFSMGFLGGQFLVQGFFLGGGEGFLGGPRDFFGF